MPKLTLGVDERVVRGAKRYAAARGTSVSRLVERYVDLFRQLSVHKVRLETSLMNMRLPEIAG